MRTDRRLAHAIGLGLVFGTFALYASTLAQDVPPTDSGELILAAWSPGIAHAPGFPLYILLGWLWSHLVPIGSVAWRLNLFSALMGAATVGLVYMLILRLLGMEATDQHTPAETTLAAGFGVALLAVGRTTWLWGTVAEVYSLSLAVAAAVLLLVVRWTGAPVSGSRIGVAPARQQDARQRSRRRQGAVRRAKPQVAWERRDLLLVGAALLFGLGLGAHLTSIALLAPAIAFWLTAHRGSRVWWSRPAWGAAIGLLLGAMVYLYLPLRAASNPLLNWGDPDTWQRFWWQVTAKQYRVSLFSAPVWPQVITAARLWWAQLSPVGLALLGIGAWQTARRRRDLFWFVAIIIACALMYAWAYVIEDDQDAYYLTAYAAGAIWVVWGTRSVVAWVVKRWSSARPISIGLLAAIPALVLVWNFSTCNRSMDTISGDYARDALSEVAQNGLVLTRDWQFYSPILYLQAVEGYRTDVTVIDTELLRRGWYFALLHKQDPALMASVADEEANFLQIRDAWERGDIPDGDPRIQKLQSSYVALIDAFIAQARLFGREVHAGPNRGVASEQSATLQGIPDMEPGVGSAVGWVPAGLTFLAITEGEAIPEPAALDWHLGGLLSTVPTAPERKVVATRADMATLHGLYQASLGRVEEAIVDLRLARSIDPTYEPARVLLGRLGVEE